MTVVLRCRGRRALRGHIGLLLVSVVRNVAYTSCIP
jgi:hypothetical protein